MMPATGTLKLMVLRNIVHMEGRQLIRTNLIRALSESSSNNSSLTLVNMATHSQGTGKGSGAQM